MLSLRPCVKQVCRYADGYQPHLVSPEKGIRALGVEALDQVEGPVKSCVQAVYTLLVNAARCAAGEGVDCHRDLRLSGQCLSGRARPICLGVWSDHLAFTLCREAADKAGEHTEAALMGSLPMYVPDFKNVVMPAIVHALDEWRNEAEKSERAVADA